MTLRVHMYFTLILTNSWRRTWMHILYSDVNVNDDKWQQHCFEVQSNYSYSAE